MDQGRLVHVRGHQRSSSTLMMRAGVELEAAACNIAGGGSLTTAQKAPSCPTASMNSVKSTGLTTYALAPNS